MCVSLAVFPNPGGGSVKLVQVDKVKSKRILAEVTVHASVEEVSTLFISHLTRSDVTTQQSECWLVETVSRAVKDLLPCEPAMMVKVL